MADRPSDSDETLRTLPSTSQSSRPHTHEEPRKGPSQAAAARAHRQGKPRLCKDGSVVYMEAPLAEAATDDEADADTAGSDDGHSHNIFQPPVVSGEIFEEEALTMAQLQEFRIGERHWTGALSTSAPSTPPVTDKEASMALLNIPYSSRDGLHSDQHVSPASSVTGAPIILPKRILPPAQKPLSMASVRTHTSQGVLRRLSQGSSSSVEAQSVSKDGAGGPRGIVSQKPPPRGPKPDWFTAISKPPAVDAQPPRGPRRSRTDATPVLTGKKAVQKLKKVVNKVGIVAAAVRPKSDDDLSDDEQFEKRPEKAPKENASMNMTKYYTKLSKSYEAKRQELERKKKEFVQKNATADVLAKMRQGHLSIQDFMQHFSRIGPSEKAGMIQRLITSSMHVHSELVKQGKVVELFTSLQAGVSSLFELQEQVDTLVKDILGATGAKLYLARDVPYERLERLGNSSLQCSFSSSAQRISIIQAAAVARMPVSINNAWNHHNYNDRWDGPKAFSLMAIPVWKNAEPREGEMVGLLQIYKSAVATDPTTHIPFSRADESTARLLSLPIGPLLEQLRNVNSIAAQASKVINNSDIVRLAGLRCLNIVLEEPQSRTSCTYEMSKLLHYIEELAAISVQASAATLYFLDPKDKTLFSCRPIQTPGAVAIKGHENEQIEYFHMINSMAGKHCSSGKALHVELDVLQETGRRDQAMCRQDRHRERITKRRLHNIMAIPIFANAQNTLLIREYAMTLKPKNELIVDDIDALRLPIATTKGRLGRSSVRTPKTVDLGLAKWAKVGLKEDVGELQMIGVLQVINGVVNLDLGEEGGFRAFMDEDEMVLKEIVNYISQLMAVVLRRHSRQLSINSDQHIANKMEEVVAALPQLHGSIDIAPCTYNCLLKTREIMDADYARIYLFSGELTGLDDVELEEQMLSVYSLIGQPDTGYDTKPPQIMHWRRLPSMVKHTIQNLAIARLESTEIQAGGVYVEGMDVIEHGKDQRVTKKCLSIPLYKPVKHQATRKRPGTQTRGGSRAGSRNMPFRPPKLTHVGSPLNAMVGVIAVGTFEARVGESQKVLADENVLKELARIVGMSLCNALKRREQIAAFEEKRRLEREEEQRQAKEAIWQLELEKRQREEAEAENDSNSSVMSD